LLSATVFINFESDSVHKIDLERIAQILIFLHPYHPSIDIPSDGIISTQGWLLRYLAWIA
jgi:hypothetical protein